MPTQYQIEAVLGDITIVPLTKFMHDYLGGLYNEELSVRAIRMLQEWTGYLAEHRQAQVVLHKSRYGRYTLSRSLINARKASKALARKWATLYYSDSQGGRMAAEDLLNANFDEQLF
jgi:hypothetical protein